MQQQTPGGMAQNAQVRALQRAQQAVGHFGGFEVHVGMDAADHEVQFCQRVVLQIERAVFQDVAFYAGEHADAKAVAIDFADAGGEFHHPALI